MKPKGDDPVMEIYIARDEMEYDGSQLSSHFALKTFGVRGDNLVVFKGPMNVKEGHMADLEDRLARSTIRSARMLHFIVEIFRESLESMILKQRLLARLAADILGRETGVVLRVKGDDLYHGKQKVSVSIAAPSPVSCLIHFGLNISTQEVPVEAAGLEELGMDPDRMADLLATAFQQEMKDVNWAVSKVRGIP
jgi:hypothetical protein